MRGMPAPEPGQEGRHRAGRVTLERSFPLVLLVLVVGAVVTVATNGLQLLLPASDLDDGGAWGVQVAGVATAVAGLAWLLVHRKRIRTDGGRGTDPTGVALRTAATIMGLLTLIALLNPPPRSGDDTSGEAAFGLSGAAPTGGDGRARDLSPPRLPGSDPNVIGRRRLGESASEPVAPPVDNRLLQVASEVLARVLLVVMALIGLGALALRRRRRREKLPEDIPLTPADAEAGLEASLGEVTGASLDPRRQITDAYHRLLTALAAAGALRQPQEAPHEHLYRVLGPLGVRPEPLHRLTELYVLAQFSGRPITEQHRAAAEDALEVSLADLRTAHRSAGSHGAHHVPEEANA